MDQRRSGKTLVPVAALAGLWGALAAGASDLIDVPDRVDHFFDDARGILFVSTEAGNIERWDAASGTLLSPYAVGGSLRGMDVTPDGQTIYAADYVVGEEGGRIRVVDVDTGGSTEIGYALAFGEGGAWDVVIGMQGTGFVTTQFEGSGWVPLRALDTTSNQLTVVAGPTSGDVRQRTKLSRSADRGLVLMEESNTSAGPVHTYDFESDQYQASLNTQNSRSNLAAAVSPDGSVVALENFFPRAIDLYDAELQFLRRLPVTAAGVLFDPANPRFFYADEGSDELVALSTNTYEELARWPIGESYSGGPWWEFRRVASATGDGTTVFLSTSSGVRAISTTPLPRDTDSDEDGVFDDIDNCVLRANPAQVDADGDGLGNLCDGDFNGDWIVNVTDLGLMKAAFFTSDPVIDLNSDGVVNVIDLGILRTLAFQ